MRTSVLGLRRELLNDGRVDDESGTQNEAAVDLERSSTNIVNGENTDGRTCEGHDGVDCGQKQGHACGDSDLCLYDKTKEVSVASDNGGPLRLSAATLAAVKLKFLLRSKPAIDWTHKYFRREVLDCANLFKVSQCPDVKLCHCLPCFDLRLSSGS